MHSATFYMVKAQDSSCAHLCYAVLLHCCSQGNNKINYHPSSVVTWFARLSAIKMQKSSEVWHDCANAEFYSLCSQMPSACCMGFPLAILYCIVGCWSASVNTLEAGFPFCRWLTSAPQLPAS